MQVPVGSLDGWSTTDSSDNEEQQQHAHPTDSDDDNSTSDNEEEGEEEDDGEGESGGGGGGQLSSGDRGDVRGFLKVARHMLPKGMLTRMEKLLHPKAEEK